MKALLIINSLGCGGAERNLCWLAAFLAEKGIEVSVATFESPAQEPFYALDSRVRLIRLDCATSGIAWPLKPARLIKLLMRLRRTAAIERPDLIVSFMDQNNLLTLMALGRRTEVTVCERVNPERGSAAERPMLRTILSFFKRLLYPQARAIVVQTAAALEALPQGWRKRAHVVPNPVPPPPRRFVRAPLDPPIVLFVGRLVRQKRIDLLLQAFEEAQREVPDASLEIVGDGPLRDQLAAFARQLGIEGKVRFTGAQSDPFPFYGRAACFVLCSDYEGFPGALAEAMSCGVPVLSTNCRFGPEELITHGVNGLLVPAGDTAAIAKGVLRLITDSSYARGLGAAAPAVCAKFSEERVGAHWLEALGVKLTDERHS